MTVTTFYRWKRTYGGLEVDDAKKMKALGDENRRLKQPLDRRTDPTRNFCGR